MELRALLGLALISAVVRGIPVTDFYQHQENVKTIEPDDDGTSLPISLDPPLPYYGKSYNNCSVSANGILEFQNGPLSDLLRRVNNTPFPICDHTFIAPFYADFDNERGGRISYSDRPVSEAKSLDKAQEQIRSFTEYKDFKPLYLIIATWVKVAGYFNSPNDLVNTLQCVVATNGTTTFSIFLYNELQWSKADGSSIHAQVGFNDGTSKQIQYWEMPCSGNGNITSLVNSSNVGVPGLWLFRIDKDIIPACPDKDGYSNIIVNCEDDELCSCLTLENQQCVCREDAMEEKEDFCEPQPPSPSQVPGKKDNTTGVAIGVSVALFFGLIITLITVGIIVFIICQSKNSNTNGNKESLSTDHITQKNGESDKTAESST